VRATGYQPNTAATLTITSVSSSSTLDTASVTASADGIISTTWVVSSSADVGDYTIRLSAQTNAKAIQDAESFTVSGYAIKIQTINLAGQVVPSVSLQAKDATTGTVYNATSDSSDRKPNLKKHKRYNRIMEWRRWRNEITVSGDGTFTISCQ
jgi:hypothetical protein